MELRTLTKVSIFAHCVEECSSVSEFFVDVFKKKTSAEIVHVQFPFIFSKSKAVRVTIESSGQTKEVRSHVRFYRPQALSYIKDFIYALFYGFRYARGSDIFISGTNLIALAGIMLRALRVLPKSCKIVYVMIDYTPRRFQNGILNSLYLFIDKLAMYYSYQVWPLSEAMIKARFEAERVSREKVRYHVISSGNKSDNYSAEWFQKNQVNRIAYLGGVIKSKGAELFIPIIRNLINRGFNDVIFECVGGGDIDYLREEARKQGVEDSVKIYGLVEDFSKVEAIMQKCSVAIAPYCPHDKNSFTFFSDPQKIKDYLGWGLPVVLTDVPPNAKDIVTAGAGLLAEYDANDIAAKIQKIIEDKEVYQRFRQSAIEIGKKYSWTNVLTKAVSGL